MPADLPLPMPGEQYTSTIQHHGQHLLPYTWWSPPPYWTDDYRISPRYMVIHLVLTLGSIPPLRAPERFCLPWFFFKTRTTLTTSITAPGVYFHSLPHSLLPHAVAPT